LLVAGLARHFARQGLRVAPFKPQNMSNNAAVTVDGGEIGRAQALQARAAGREPLTDMNPVLLKPETDRGAQVIVQGKRLATVAAREYAALKPTLLPCVLDSFRRLAATADLILVEGAGSPAEINLRSGDIANMGFAEAADLPVVIAGDIDRGGVIAQIVGTHTVLPDSDRARIRGFLVNRFRGDPALFADGRAEIARRTGWADLGLVPWFDDARRLPAEDILDLRGSRRPGARVTVAVPRLPRIANFDDLDPLAAEPDVDLRLIDPGQSLPGDADLVLLPGSKTTIADLARFQGEGWDIDLAAHVRRGGHVLGLCGGFQMLGRRIEDPDGIEGPPGGVEGLGLLDVTTVMRADKTLCRVAGFADGQPVVGYEIHLGHTTGPDTARAWATIDGRPAGASSPDGRIRGIYVHGLFAADAFRRACLERLGGTPGTTLDFEGEVEAALDRLADHLASHLDTEALLALAQTVRA